MITFRLTAEDADRTTVALAVSDCPTDEIYKHLVFYGSVTLEVLKRFAEQTDPTGDQSTGRM